jgi:hypothetical protein
MTAIAPLIGPNNNDNGDNNKSVVQIRPCDLFQFGISSEVMNQFDIWWDTLDGGSAQRKAYTYTGQHNTERRGQTSMP